MQKLFSRNSYSVFSLLCVNCKYDDRLSLAYCLFVAEMKLYSLTVMYKGLDGRVKKLCGASDLASFGYFQRSRSAALFADILV